MCCNALIKLLEWTGMFHLTVYSFLTLIYVTAHALISIALVYSFHQPLQLLLTAYALFVSCFLYVQALACLTATDRMQSMMDIITGLVPLPGYQRVRGMRRNQRVYLLFGHFLQIQYSMMFKNLYKEEIKKGTEILIEYSKTVNFWQFLNQMYILFMIAMTLGAYIIVYQCSKDCLGEVNADG